ncbi:MAG TPA: AsnC family protein [Anaerolineales bacterium]|nr:AsnC family protein [Anaerolineales bacterium]
MPEQISSHLLDSLDKLILSILQTDGRISNAELARQIKRRGFIPVSR